MAGRRTPAPTWATLRDIALFTTGLALIIWEAIFRTGPERPTLLLLYAGMVGLPAFLRSDERAANREEEHQP